MKRIIVAVSLATAACAANLPGMPGTISDKKSEFDGGRIVYLQPANAGTYGLAMGAQWRSSASDYVQIVVQWLGEYAAIQDRAGLEFNADGRIIQLDSIGLPTDFTATPGPGYMTFKTSTKIFAMPRVDFQAL